MDIKITIGADARLLETINRLTDAIIGSNRVQGTLQEIPGTVLKANESQRITDRDFEELKEKQNVLAKETVAEAKADEAFEEKHALHESDHLSARIVDIPETEDQDDQDEQDNSDRKIYTEAELKELELSEIMPILTAMGVDPAQTPGMNTNKKLRTLVLQAQEKGGQTIKERIHERANAQKDPKEDFVDTSSLDDDLTKSGALGAEEDDEVKEVSNESFRAQIARLNDLDKRQMILDAFAKYKVSKQSQLEGVDRWNCYNELCAIK